MNFQSILIVASICVIVKMTGAEITINDMGPMLNMLDTNRRSNSLLSMEQGDSLLRKKRSSSLLSTEKSLVANDIDLKQINNMLAVDIGDIDNEGTIKKRHARRNHHNHWHHSHLDNENKNNNEKVKSRDSSEESEEVNTEDPSYIASAENVSKKLKEEVPAKQKNDRRRKNHSKHENRDKDNESKNVKHSENNETDNKKRKDSGEEADNKEFIFMDLPREISANKENKRRKDRNNRHNHRDEKDMIEEENVVTTASDTRK